MTIEESNIIVTVEEVAGCPIGVLPPDSEWWTLYNELIQEQMENVPEKIYLDLGRNCQNDCDFNELSQVTWSQDNATGNGIEFTRSDIAALLQNCENHKKSCKNSKPDKELLDALKIAQKLLSENLPLIQDFRKNQLRELWDSPTFTHEAYQAKAADIHNENKYAYDLLVKINEAISNYEKLHK